MTFDILKGAALAVLIVVSARAATVTVTVKDSSGNRVSGAKVAAIAFDPATGDPSPASVVRITDAQGNDVSLPIPDYVDHAIIVSRQGYSPTVRDQVFDPAQQLVKGPGDVSRTVTLTPISRVGWVQSDVVVPGPATASSPKLVFVQIVHKTTRESVAFTVHAATAASPASTPLIVENVPVAAGGSYQVEAFVPDADVTKKAGLTQDVTPSVPDNGFAGIPGMNFADTSVAFAPDRSASAPPSGGAAGNLSVEGVVVNAVSSAAVPNAWVSIHADGQNLDAFGRPVYFWMQNMTDNSGHFSFYDVPVSTFSFEAQAPGFEGYKSISVPYNGVRISTRVPLMSATGVILGRVRIRDTSGNLVNVPQVGGGAWGDWGFWNGGGQPGDKFAPRLTYSPTDYHPGGGNFFSANGDFKIDGLSAGNYQLQIWTPFIQNGYRYNDGLNRTENTVSQIGASGPVHSGDDLRISVDTGPPVRFAVFNATGGFVTNGGWVAYNALPSDGLQVELPISTGATGTISGAIHLVNPLGPVSTTTPVAVMAYPQYDFSQQTSISSPPTGGIAVVTGPGPDFTYTMNVSAGYKYWVEVKTREYGRQNFGPSNNNADLTTVASVSGIDFTLAPAGIIQGRLRLPDGSIFKPINGPGGNRWANINARGMDVESWGWGQVDDNGKFEMTGLLPGRYLIMVDGYGTDWVWGRGRMADVAVKAGQTVQVEVPIPVGAPVHPAPDPSQLPSPPSLFTYRVMGVPSGTTLTVDKLRQLFSEDPEIAFYVGGSGRAMDTPQGVWQTLRLAKGRYDFYMALSQEFGVAGESHGPGEVRGPRDSMTFLDIKKNVTVPDRLPPGTTVMPTVPVQFTPVIGNASVGGKCGGKDIIRQRDMDLARQQGLDNIKNLLPVVAVYDSSGGLRGFSNGYPSGLTLAAFGQMIDFVNRGDLKGFKNLFVQSYPLSYQCPLLPAGTYTLVATTKNYPPAVKKVTLASAQNLTLDIDFDKDAPPPGTLRGLVTDAAKNPLPLASVNIKNKATTRVLMTAPNGRYQFEGLPPGIYTITVSKDKFAPIAKKRVLVGSADFPPIVTVDFALPDGPGHVWGAVYTRGLGAAKNPPSGARVVAYDDTLNGKKETEAVALYETKPSTDGVYHIFGLVPDHVYKVSVIVPGKVIETKSRTAITNVEDVADNRVDFPLKSEGARVQVRMKIEAGVVKLIVESQKTLASDPDCRVSPGLSFNAAAGKLLDATTWPGNAWAYSVPSAVAGQAFTAHVETTDGASSEPEKTDVTFNPEEKARAKTRLDEAAAAGGQVPLDSTGDDVTSLDVPTGSILATGSIEISKQAEGRDGAPEYIIGGLASSLPGAEMGKNDRNLSTTFQGIAKSIMASDAYKVSLSNTQISRPLTLSLAYDVGKVDDPSKLKIYQWNETLRIWEEVPGPRILDPLSGNVSVEVNSITEASKGTSAKGPAAGIALHDGAQFSVNRAASTSQQATFAVFQGQPPTKIAYNGTEFQGYNFPNPFDLTAKRPSLKDGGSLGTAYPKDTATVIRYGLPAAMTGEVTFEIYNLAGELVRTINDGSQPGGFLYYTDWDGKNDNNADVASGVYFVVAKVAGVKQKVMKFAVLK